VFTEFVPVAQRGEKRDLKLGFTDSCEPLCEYWELIQRLLQEQSVLFFFFFFFGSFFFPPELGTEPRALRFLGKRSTTELNPQPQSVLLITKLSCLPSPETHFQLFKFHEGVTNN